MAFLINGATHGRVAVEVKEPGGPPAQSGGQRPPHALPALATPLSSHTATTAAAPEGRCARRKNARRRSVSGFSAASRRTGALEQFRFGLGWSGPARGGRGRSCAGRGRESHRAAHPRERRTREGPPELAVGMTAGTARTRREFGGAVSALRRPLAPRLSWRPAGLLSLNGDAVCVAPFMKNAMRAGNRRRG
jgi:hypothetical protein